MLIILFLLGLVLFISLKIGKEVFIANFVVLLGAMILHFVIYLEYNLGITTDYFLSDEIFYLSEYFRGNVDWQTGNVESRKLWFIINGALIDTGAADVIFKMVNIPFLLLLNCYFYLLSEKNKLALWLPFILPYLLFISVTNLRDVLIFMSLLGMIYHAFQIGMGHKLLAFVFALLLFNLRPFSLFIGAGVIVGFMIFQRDRQIKTLAKIVVLMVIALVAVILAPMLKGYYDTVIYVLSTPGVLREGHRGFGAFDVVEYFVRSFLAPFPSTLAIMLSQGETHSGWGYAHDIIRILNQLSVMALFVVLGWKSLVALINRRIFDMFEFGKYGKILVIIFFFHTLAYALYSAGTMHSRLHLFGNLMILVLVMSVYNNRDNRQATNLPNIM